MLLDHHLKFLYTCYWNTIDTALKQGSINRLNQMSYQGTGYTISPEKGCYESLTAKKYFEVE